VLAAGDAAVVRVDRALGTDAARAVLGFFEAFAARIVRIIETTHDGLRENPEHRTQKPGSKS
jgi:hypothetical protein